MTYKVILRRPARKALVALPPELQQRILRALESLADDPRPRGTRAMQGHEGLLRMEDAREMENMVAFYLGILPRPRLW